ncbi:MAG: GNAT family N-acetyltransferase [Sagittula sp.]|jgi:L-ornithine Nalpha-acyltransferase|uniref:GNAT family N-acetyltransferase n=1 Tax=unclassified Sagittula TaxID=2624628 RepID=UPI000C2CF8CC|nr:MULTISPECIES: GNAT family N-acyltransferase [unclassified Sagittula]AUC55355.1 ornithine-acyl-ACP acyltransferase [Sagittula sp. P11]WHZ37489.1 GNAT family N-acyltransferase [Sagittula sp. MA-2]
MSDSFTVRLARDAADVAAAQRLRYDVFVAELGGDGPLVDHENRLERDRFDPFFDHLLVCDPARGDMVVGVYRLLRDDRAAEAGQFYSEDEYDLGPLRRSGRRLLELGRSCLHPDYRGGPAMFHLWQGLAAYVTDHGIEVLFGTASFHGTDIARLAQPLSLLHHRHLAPPDLRVRARNFQDMNLVPEADIDRVGAMLEVPALIKAYLRLGGCVGEGAYVDHAFNTTDVCLVMDTARMTERQRAVYTRERAT